MSWVKRNLYFVISCTVAVVLLGAAAWYCWSSRQAYNTNTEQLKTAYDQMKQFADKKPGPGNDQINNIQTAKDETEQAKQRVAELEKFFTPVKGIPDTNKFNDRMLSAAVRETVSQLRAAAQAKGVTVPVGMPEFAFSFSLQMGKAIYDANSAEVLTKQLGEVKTICDTLFGARIQSLDSIQRERTADDIVQQQIAPFPDYTDSLSFTNGNMVVTPYQVTFQCFTPQLGAVLSGFANQSHTIVVKTLNIQPMDLAPGMGDGGQNYGAYAAYGAAARAGGVVIPQPVTPQGQQRPGALPTIIDEKKLKVIMLLDFIKIIPAQGK